jgi:hypothetical protein
MPDQILFEEGRLDDVERTLFREHCRIGAAGPASVRSSTITIRPRWTGRVGGTATLSGDRFDEGVGDMVRPGAAGRIPGVPARVGAMQRDARIGPPSDLIAHRMLGARRGQLANRLRQRRDTGNPLRGATTRRASCRSPLSRLELVRASADTSRAEATPPTTGRTREVR